MFNRDRFALQASGILGEDDTWGGENIVSGIYGKLSMSAGYSHFETDGWRENGDQEDDIANIFAQYEITYKTSVQAEYRYRDTETGDLEMTFLEDDVLPYLREEDKTKSFRLGFHHGFAPGADLIGNFQYSDGERSVHDEDPDPDFVFPIFTYDLENDDEEAYSGELSYLHRSNYVNFVIGGGHFDIDSEDQISLALDFGVPPPLVLDEFDVDADTSHSNVYLYSYIKPLQNLTITVGASGDFFEADDELVEDEDQFNPKLGVTLDLASGTTLRAAAFRVLKRTLITDQTLEPTQIAGFNQFFDELNATDYWRYGGGIDQKFSDSIYGGVEYTYRDLNVPYVDATGLDPEKENSNWDEKIARAYMFWAPCNYASLTAEYRYEDLERDEQGSSGTTDSKTHFVPLGINLFHTSGLSASLKGTYVNQDGEFETKDDRGVFEDGDDDFWLVDVAVNYRLPKRYGFITVGVNNVFDEGFDYFDSDWENPQIQPERFVYGKITLALP
jgi:opacity protein-like surface antigen